MIPAPFRLPRFTLAILLGALPLACTDTGVGGDDDSAPGEGDDDASSGSLTATFYASPWQAQLGQTTEFHADESTDSKGTLSVYSDCEIAWYHWDFGDGQLADEELFSTEHTYSATGLFPVTLTVEDGQGQTATFTAQVEVVHPAALVTELDVSADAVAVVGEWVSLRGHYFRTDNLPAVSFGGSVAHQLFFVSAEEIAVQVPPQSPSGEVEVGVEFPDGVGDALLATWVKRFVLMTDAFHDTVHILSFGEGITPEVASQSLTVESATVVKISGDGATALVGDGRYELNLTPTLTFLDLTADFQPVVTRTSTSWGLGPLFDIAVARDAPRALIADVSGLTVLDIADPYNPISLGRTAWSISDLAATDVELTPDGSLGLVLGTFDDRVRLYSVSEEGAVELPETLSAGEGVQDLQLSPDGQTAYVLGGGGEGAIPPDLSFDNATLTLYDLGSWPPVNVWGEGTSVPVEDHAPIPFDLAVGASGQVYISSFDQNFSIIGDAFGDLFDDFLDIGAWEDLINAFTEISFGGVTAFTDPATAATEVAQTLWVPYGFQTGLAIRYDEQAYVSAAIFLDFIWDVGDLDIHAELNMSVGVVVGDLTTGETMEIPLAHDALLYYEGFTFDYDYAPLVSLLLPPYSFGDIAVQP